LFLVEEKANQNQSEKCTVKFNILIISLQIKFMAKQTGISTGGMVGAGLTVGAMAVASYMMFGPHSKKNQKVVRGWAVKMKGEIIEGLEKAKDVTEPVYHKIVDQAVEKYSKIKNVDQKELAALVADTKKHWKAMTKGTKSALKGKAKK
jgi:hypothetical protein